MSLLQAIILGIVQGLTEFLPISSTAHLVLVPFFLGWTLPEEQAFVFDVLVQLGTLVAVIVYFWNDLVCIAASFIRGVICRQPFADPNARMGWYLILATIPAGLAGLLLRDQIEFVFNSPAVTSFFLIATAVLLLVSERIGRKERPLRDLNWKDALWIGIAQAIAVFPGISRSGATIAGGLSRQLERPAAGRFSFLMSLPILMAAGLMASLDLNDIPEQASFIPVMAAGFITSAVVGYLAIRWLLSYLSRNSLRWFSLYCMVVALLTLFLAYA